MFMGTFLFSQNKKLDSLYAQVKTKQSDTSMVNLYNQISYQLIKQKHYNKAIKYSEMSLKLCSNKKFIKGFYKANQNLWRALNDSGVEFYEDAIYAKALDLYIRAYPYSILSGSKINEGYANSNIGNVYKSQKNYIKAYEYYFKALEIRKVINDKRTLSIAYSNVGHVYKNIKDSDCEKINIDPSEKLNLAYEYYVNALSASQSINEKPGIAAAYASIASIYEAKKLYPLCLEASQNNLKSSLESSSKKFISASYNRIGKIFLVQSENDFIAEGLNIKDKDSLIMYNLLYALKYAEETTDLATKRDVYGNLAEYYYNVSKFKNAFEFQKKFKIFNDSIYNIENADKMSDIITNYEAEKKDIQFKIDKEKADILFNQELKQKQIIYDFQKRELFIKSENEKDKILFQETKKRKELDYAFKNKMLINKIEQEKQQEVNRLNQKRKNSIISFVVFGLIVLVCFSIFIYRRLRISKEQNNIIENQKKEVETQKHLVEEKHKEITDSINYAERIQRALLASKKMLDENLNSYFILFKPKDVVSGDFYWANKLSNGNFVLVTADSTGHGVPGAIMSIVNIASLKEAVVQGIISPDLILNETRKLIIENLKNDGSAEGGKDGMDGSILCFDFKNNVMTCSCANNPIWIIRKSKDDLVELIEIKPDRMPIGKHDKDRVPFTLHTIELKKGDVVYTLTDGFPDQFGGESGKKFKSKQLQEILLSIVNEPMEIQKKKLNSVFDNWKGDLEQVDDVCVIGIRV
jgi:serine phosphatase RsbU (regulator of sigma subunit)/tetratricopeptide (TPR) repeat protein